MFWIDHSGRFAETTGQFGRRLASTDASLKEPFRDDGPPKNWPYAELSYPSELAILAARGNTGVCRGIGGKGTKMIALHYFDVEQSGDVTELRLADPALFDVPRYEELRNELVSFVEQRRPDRLIVDFSSVGYCSTAVIAAVLMAKKRLDSDGGQMKLCGMSDAVRETFQMLKLDGTIFDIHTTKAEAVNAF